jgi:hypothetical protein
MNLKRNTKSGFVEIVFGPRWTYIATVRLFLQKFLAITLADNKSADVISMAASELLENAVKYASEEGTRIAVEYLKQEKKLLLTVENFANEENLGTLKNELDYISSGDPQEIYLQKMQQAALRNDGGSQLGFSRIRYETNAEISCEVEGDLVKVTAIFDLK